MPPKEENLVTLSCTSNNDNNEVLDTNNSKTLFQEDSTDLSDDFIDDIDYILSELTDDEIDIAARASYRYQKNSANSNNDGEKIHFASEMIQRYLTSKSDKIIALQKLKATLQFRKDMNLNNLLQMTNDNKNELYNFLKDKKSYVQGYDKCGRSTYIFIPRNVTDHKDCKQTINGHVWSIEKAIACTKSIDNTVNVVVDFNNFSLYSHSPPLTVGKELMTILRNHYVGHINKIYLINPPSAFTLLWNIFKSFAGSKTKKKMIFVNTNSIDNNSINQDYTKEQVTSWMIPTGEKNRELDIIEYLDVLPFDKSFDEQ